MAANALTDMVVPWFQAWQNKIVEPNLSPGRIWSLRLSAYNPLLGCQVNKGTKQEWHCAAARLLNVNLISRAPKNIIKHQKYDPLQHHTASIMDTSDTSDISPGFFFLGNDHENWPRCYYQTTGGPGAAGGDLGFHWSSAWASFGWVNS